MVRRIGRDVRRELPGPHPVADGAAPAAGVEGDDRVGDPVGSVRGGPDRPARADARPLVPDDRRPCDAVHRRRRLDGGLWPSSADGSRRDRRLSLGAVARGMPAPDARRMVGARPLPAPHRRGRRSGAAHLRVVRRRGDRHARELRPDARRRSGRATAAHGSLGPPGQQRHQARRARLRPRRRDRHGRRDDLVPGRDGSRPTAGRAGADRRRRRGSS